jgi:hypothetical protein
MAEKTIPQVFGTGAERLASGATTPSAGLFIPDSVLISAGLATPSSATAEGHLTAILLTTQGTMTQAGFDADTDQSIYASNGFSSFTTRGTTPYRVDQITYNLAKIDSGATLDPDDY